MDEEKRELEVTEEEPVAVVGADGIVTDPPAQQTEEETKPETLKEGRSKTRTNIFYGAAGAYLLYLTYKLSDTLLDKSVEGWPTSRIVSLCAMILFSVSGMMMLIKVIKSILGDFRSYEDTDDDDNKEER